MSTVGVTPSTRTDGAVPGHGRPVSPSHGVLLPLGQDEVVITDGFWKRMQSLNGERILNHCEAWIDRIGYLDNFNAAVEGRLPEARKGPPFADSDAYKLLEAMAWEIGRTEGTDLERRLTALVDRLAPVQESDGYIHTAFGHAGQPPRYSDLEWGHELYCFGHLIQAGVARLRTVGEDMLAEVARRVADHVCATFGPGGIDGVDGHPEIEVALVELARATGENRYLEQARLFIERRGHGRLAPIGFGAEYFQDDIPVRDASVLRGHAVRALYLAAGATDVAVETGDDQLLAAVVRQQAHTVAHRTYVTGGMGAHHEGESFGADDELPPDRSYSETCAGVASIMTSARLLFATGDPTHADLVERTLYNVIATSPADDGEAFFYTNTLYQRTQATEPETGRASARAASGMRAPWFEVACCPPNVARLLASLAAYIATMDDEGVQIQQYVGARVSTHLPDGRSVQLELQTGYPTDGKVVIRSLYAEPAEWTLTLRIPAWAGSGATVAVNGAVQPARPGAVHIRRVFTPGDVVELTLPVEPRWTWPDPNVDAIRGTVAVEQGPTVLAAESTDIPSEVAVDALRVDTRSLPQWSEGVVTVQGRLSAARPDELAWPYHSTFPRPRLSEPFPMALIPYRSWGNRGPSTMRIWLPLATETGTES